MCDDKVYALPNNEGVKFMRYETHEGIRFRRIRIEWENPRSIEEVRRLNHPVEDYGLYQIYGTHPSSGSDTLLYIGRVGGGEQANPFRERFRNHEFIEKYRNIRPAGTQIMEELSVRIGRIKCGDYAEEPPHYPDWINVLIDAEKLLICYYYKRVDTLMNERDINVYDGQPLWIKNTGDKGDLAPSVLSIYIDT